MKNPMTLEQAKEAVRREFSHYANGHSEYMIVDVDRDKFLNWAADKVIDPEFEEPIAGLSFEEENGVTVARFNSCEKFPELNSVIQEAFPGAIVYGIGCWDYAEVVAPKDAYDALLEECFEDFGSLRIDVLITDKKSGCTVSVGDLVSFESSEDVSKADENSTYSYLTGLLNVDERKKVEEQLKACEEYWRNEEDAD